MRSTTGRSRNSASGGLFNRSWPTKPSRSVGSCSNVSRSAAGLWEQRSGEISAMCNDTTSSRRSLRYSISTSLQQRTVNWMSIESTSRSMPLFSIRFSVQRSPSSTITQLPPVSSSSWNKKSNNGATHRLTGFGWCHRWAAEWVSCFIRRCSTMSSSHACWINVIRGLTIPDFDEQRKLHKHHPLSSVDIAGRFYTLHEVSLVWHWERRRSE